MNRAGFRSILVAGGGIVGHSAALAFARALPGATVTLLRLPPDPAALADRLGATLPPVARFHAAIGIDERDLARRDIATHHLATRFDRWPATGDPWIHGFGSVGRRTGGIAFHQLWLRAHQAGKALPYDRYSAAATVAAAGKFVHPSEDIGSPLSTYIYALSLDPGKYRDVLEEAALSRGVVAVDGDIAGVEGRTDGGIASLRLLDGRSLDADLFIDCSGPSAALLSRVDDGFEEWSRWLPFDRVTVDAALDSVASPLVVVDADDGGWTMNQGGTRVRLTSSASEAPGPARIALRPGRRTKPWTANVLAIGDSAVALDPLHGTNLHLAQSAILRALELLPGRDCAPIETAEYNRRTAIEVCRVRDFLALHYHRCGRTGPGWRQAAGSDLPDSLARVIEQFEARGRIAFHEEETFSTESWAAAMLGLGIVPRRAAATAGAVDLAAIVKGMDSLAHELVATERRLPPYAAYLARFCDPA